MKLKSPTEPKPLKKFFTANLLAGLSVLIPLYLTFLILRAMVRTIDQAIRDLPGGMRYEFFSYPGVGVLVAFFLTLLVGILFRNVLGRMILKNFNLAVQRVPLVASIYGILREVSETIFGEKRSKSFQQVVMVEWPRHGVWSMGFVTAETTGLLAEHLKNRTKHSEFLNVFLPTTPNPTSGFYFVVPRSEVILLNISVDQAFKNIISGGSLPPDHFSST